MTSSNELRQQAADIVRALHNELDERRFAQDVDESVERALATFGFDWRSEMLLRQLQRAVHRVGFEPAGNGAGITLDPRHHRRDLPTPSGAFPGQQRQVARPDARFSGGRAQTAAGPD